MSSKFKEIINKPLTIIFIASITAMMSFQRFKQCISINWSGYKVYQLGCYSDIPPLYFVNKIYQHIFPYEVGSTALQYPSLLISEMYLTALTIPKNHPNLVRYFITASIITFILYLLTVNYLVKINRENIYFILIAPASLYSIYINWDMLAILPMIAGLYYFSKGRISTSGILLSLATSAKFIPVFLLLPVNLILLRDKKYRQMFKINITFVITWALINIPLLVKYPSGFLDFYKFNLKRNPDWGSYWFAFKILFNPHDHLLSIAVTLAVIGIFILYTYKNYNKIELYSYSFTVITVVMLTSKVYSPQYVIWLTALATTLPNLRKNLIPYILWQASELLYNQSIWSHLALMNGYQAGMQDRPYALVSLIRIILMSLFLIIIIRDKKELQP